MFYVDFRNKTTIFCFFLQNITFSDSVGVILNEEVANRTGPPPRRSKSGTRRRSAAASSPTPPTAVVPTVSDMAAESSLAAIMSRRTSLVDLSGDFDEDAEADQAVIDALAGAPDDQEAGDDGTEATEATEPTDSDSAGEGSRKGRKGRPSKRAARDVEKKKHKAQQRTQQELAQTILKCKEFQYTTKEGVEVHNFA